MIHVLNPDTKMEYRKNEIVNNTVKEDLAFRIRSESLYQYGRLKSFSLIQNSCATTVPVKIDNWMVVNSIKLFADRDIFLKNDTILKDTDFLSHSSIKDLKIVEEETYRSTADIYIRFKEDFHNHVGFEKEFYTFKIICTTSDNKILIDSTTVFMDL